MVHPEIAAERQARVHAKFWGIARGAISRDWEQVAADLERVRRLPSIEDKDPQEGMARFLKSLFAGRATPAQRADVWADRWDRYCAPSRDGWLYQ